MQVVSRRKRRSGGLILGFLRVAFGLSGIVFYMLIELVTFVARLLSAPAAARAVDVSPCRHVPQSVRHQVFRRDGGRCLACGSHDDLHYDHVVPFAHGGSSDVDNIQLLCAGCNLSKGARYWKGF